MKKKKIVSVLLSFILVFMFAVPSLAQEKSVSRSSYTTATTRVGNYMYYSVYNKIYKVNVETKKSTIVVNHNSAYTFDDINVKDGWIYCTANFFGGTGGSDCYIYKVRTNGKDGKLLKKGHSPVVYNGNIYYIKLDYEKDEYGYNYDTDNIGIYKMSLSGKNNKCLKKSSSVQEFIVYKSNIYYSNYTNNKGYLRRMSLSGGTSKVMCSGYENVPESLTAYSNYIYFNYGSKIYKIKTTSTSKSLVMSNAVLKGVYNNYVYYTKDVDYNCYLYRMNLSSKSKTFLMKKEINIGSLDISNGYIILEYYYSGGRNNTAKYLCNDKGKNGKILKTYYLS